MFFAPIYRIYREYLRIFNVKSINVSTCDVGLNVIKPFEYCNNINKSFLNIIREFFKIDLEYSTDIYTCIDLLGVFVVSENEYIGNIFLSPKRIEEYAKKFNITYSVLYDFVKFHEEAHSLMSPELIFKQEKKYISKNFYIFFEEMLATLYTLHFAMKSEEKEKLKNFVSAQPIQYKIALQFTEKNYREKVIRMMITWLLFKANRLPNTKNDLYYEYIDLDLKDKLIEIEKICLFEDIKELFNKKNYVKISEVERKLNIGYNKAANILETLHNYGILSIDEIGNFIYE